MNKILFLLLVSLAASAQENLTTGPDNGALVIVGGGRVGEDITKKFIELAGGNDAEIIVIPTAAGGEIDRNNIWFANQLMEYGATNVTVIHTYDKKEADSNTFVTPLKTATAVCLVVVANGV